MNRGNRENLDLTRLEWAVITPLLAAVWAIDMIIKAVQWTKTKLTNKEQQ